MRKPGDPECGTLVEHPWAHVVGRDCDPWSEPVGTMAPWLAGVRSRSARREVVMGPHRADRGRRRWQRGRAAALGDLPRSRGRAGGVLRTRHDVAVQRDRGLRARPDRRQVIYRRWGPFTARQHPRRSVGAASARVLLDLGAGSCSTCTTWPGADTRCAPMCSGRGCGTAPGCRTGPVCKQEEGHERLEAIRAREEADHAAMQRRLSAMAAAAWARGATRSARRDLPQRNRTVHTTCG